MTYDHIAKTIGETDSSLVEKVITISNKKKIIFHGIKTKENAEKVTKEGLKPMTPEGCCSFWATGKALFLPEIDSPFFRYSGGHSEKGNTLSLNMAMARYDSLKQKNKSMTEYREDDQIKIADTVLYEDLTLIQVEITPNGEKPRELRQKGERLLLEKIAEQLSKD